MEIRIGKTAGFCYGIKRAVEFSNDDINKINGSLYCLGELVHNKQVMEELEKKGIQVIQDINEAKGITIIRAHGVPKEVYKIAKQRNITLKDYTCPSVLKVHEIVKEYAENGYFIFITGEKQHPEIIGTASHCNTDYYIIEDIEELDLAIQSFRKSNKEKIFLASQTTFNLNKFNKIKEALDKSIDYNTEFKVKNTICKSTQIRQNETEELAKTVEKMIIIGGKNSSNSKKLFEIASMNCNNVSFIETKNELSKEDFNNVNTVGIMAGASTPDQSIKEVEQWLEAL